MTSAPPPATQALVAVHDRAQALAARDFAAAHKRSLIVLFSQSVALAGGPAVAAAMVPENPPAEVTFVLDCGDDAGAAFRAAELGWTHLVTDRPPALPEGSGAIVWSRDNLFTPGRTTVDLEGSKDPAAMLARVLG